MRSPSSTRVVFSALRARLCTRRSWNSASTTRFHGTPTARYFGRGAPPGSEPELGRWLVELEQNLGVLQSRLDIRVVRLFLLCNAWNYGQVVEGQFVPPSSLHSAFQEDLRATLSIFRDKGMQIIPSLFDFKAFGRTWPNSGSGDRHDILHDPWTQRTVLEQTLAAFLEASKPYREVILAWEVMNEPVWNVSRLAPRSAAGGPTASPRALVAFLRRAVSLIEAHGFPSTVGHRFARDPRSLPNRQRSAVSLLSDGGIRPSTD